jgi:hypothetical protein
MQFVINFMEVSKSSIFCQKESKVIYKKKVNLENDKSELILLIIWDKKKMIFFSYNMGRKEYSLN